MSLVINSQMPSNVGQGGTTITSPFTYAFNNVAGTVLYVGIVTGSCSSTSLTSVTYAGVAMSLIKNIWTHVGTSGGGGFVGIYRLLSPATGSNNVVITWPFAGGYIESGAISFTGNDNVTPEKQSVSNFAGSGTTASVALTSTVSGNIILDCVGSGTPGQTTSKTLSWTKQTDGSVCAGNASGSTTAAGGSVTMSYTIANDGWGIVAVEVAAAAATGQPISYMRNPGAGFGMGF